MIENLPLALTSLNAALDIGKSLIGIHDTVLLQQKVIEFNQAIIEAQSNITAAQRNETLLLSEIDKLKKEAVRLKDWSGSKDNYTRTQVGEGVFAYVENKKVESFQDAHKLCCSCYENAIQSTLQQSKEDRRTIGLACPKRCPKITFTHYLAPQNN